RRARASRRPASRRRDRRGRRRADRGDERAAACDGQRADRLTCAVHGGAPRAAARDRRRTARARGLAPHQLQVSVTAALQPPRSSPEAESPTPQPPFFCCLALFSAASTTFVTASFTALPCSLAFSTSNPLERSPAAFPKVSCAPTMSFAMSETVATLPSVPTWMSARQANTPSLSVPALPFTVSSAPALISAF